MNKEQVINEFLEVLKIQKTCLETIINEEKNIQKI